jgi:hypothetical protein
MMKRVTKGTLGFAVAACGLLIFFQNAMAATIQVMSPEDDQIVNQSDKRLRVRASRTAASAVVSTLLGIRPSYRSSVPIPRHSPVTRFLAI